MSISRVPRTDSASTTAPVASSGGWASPAGEAVPRLPATVARLRICGEPTVREAMRQPGAFAAELVDDPGVRDAGAEADCAVVPVPLGQFGDRGQVEQGRPAARCPKFRPTIRSVPPAIGTASRVLGLRGERVGPGGGSEEVHGACQ